MQITYNNKLYTLEKFSKDKLNYFVLKAKAGSKTAKEVLFVSFLPLIKKYAGKALEYKEDFIQNFAVNFLDAVNAFSFKRKIPFAGFIKSVVRANFSSFVRKCNAFKERHAFCSEEAWGAIENTAVADDTPFEEQEANKEFLIKLLAKLTIREQEVLVYLYILDKSSKEVANYLAISHKTVLNTKLRAIAKLKKEAVK